MEVEKYTITARIKGQFGVEDTGRSERVSESILDTEDKGRMELRIQENRSKEKPGYREKGVENTDGKGWMILGEKSKGYLGRRLDESRGYREIG